MKKRHIIDNVRGTREESYAVLSQRLRRRHRLLNALRRRLNSLPSYVHDANERTYQSVKGLYIGTFVSCIGLMASTYPYMFVSDCKFMLNARDAFFVALKITFEYLYGYMLLLMVFILPAALNAVLPLISEFQTVKRVRWLVKYLAMDPYASDTRAIRSWMTISSFLIWIIVTVDVFYALKDHMTQKALRSYLDNYENVCSTPNE